MCISASPLVHLLLLRLGYVLDVPQVQFSNVSLARASGEHVTSCARESIDPTALGCFGALVASDRGHNVLCSGVNYAQGFVFAGASQFVSVLRTSHNAQKSI